MREMAGECADLGRFGAVESDKSYFKIHGEIPTCSLKSVFPDSIYPRKFPGVF